MKRLKSARALAYGTAAPVEDGMAVSGMAQPETEPPFDTVAFIMDYESGELNNDEIVAGFQHLINNGYVWTLQGSYGRTARALIEAGLCHL